MNEYIALISTPICPPDTSSNAVATRYKQVAERIATENKMFGTSNSVPDLKKVEEDVIRPVTSAIKRLVSPEQLAEVIISNALQGDPDFIKIVLDRVEGKVTEKVEITDETKESKNSIVDAINAMTNALKEVETVRVVKEYGTDTQ